MENDLQILQAFLKGRNIDSKVKSVLQNLDYSCLEWKTSNGWVNRVYNGSILIVDSQIRAYQEERFKEMNHDIFNYSLVVIKDKEQVFKWNLVQMSKDENRFDCLYLGEHNESIIHVHKHELQTTILSYKDEILKRFHSESELINRKGDIISFERIQKLNKDYPVELIKLPELTKMNSMTYNESEDLNLRPTGNFPIGYLSNK